MDFINSKSSHRHVVLYVTITLHVKTFLRSFYRLWQRRRPGGSGVGVTLSTKETPSILLYR
jgi:hypothetical protein